MFDEEDEELEDVTDDELEEDEDVLVELTLEDDEELLLADSANAAVASENERTPIAERDNSSRRRILKWG